MLVNFVSNSLIRLRSSFRSLGVRRLFHTAMASKYSARSFSSSLSSGRIRSDHKRRYLGIPQKGELRSILRGRFSVEGDRAEDRYFRIPSPWYAVPVQRNDSGTFSPHRVVGLAR